MKTKIQIKTVNGSLLFEFEKEDNSVKETIMEANLQEADLKGANLRGVDLQGAYLRGVDLQEVNLRGADLQEANLRGADLREANLQEANLQEANLRGADLQGADLQGADLQGADLQEANLRGADLQGANFREIDLQRAYAVNTILPAGELIIWKKLKDNLIAKLLIPAEAKRVNAIGSRKCRFEYVMVLAIYDREKNVDSGIGIYDSELIYKTGEIVKPDKFDDSPLIKCSNGIHGFITRQEAEDYD